MMTADITLNSVCVRYTINQPKNFSEYFSKKKPTANEVQALTNINLRIKTGERVGLIGSNGAGKSTLLKVMAQIYRPTSGRCRTTGRISPLFELATGFEFELTGWSNIRIRAMLLGMQRHQIEDKIQEIAEFTDLGHYLDYPVRTYSAGMFLRLAFAVSTAIEPEILLLDEIVGAGDAAFAQKAQQRMDSLMNQGHIVVLSSHSGDLLKRFCERTLWLEKGILRMDGPTDEVLEAYQESLVGVPA